MRGFHACRFVEADNADEAEMRCLEALRVEPTFRVKSEKLRQQTPPAKIYFEEIIEVDPDTKRTPNSGAIWFEM
jgi:hypothetical protein